MTAAELDLDAIEAYAARLAQITSRRGDDHMAVTGRANELASNHVPALVAEIRRLRDQLFAQKPVIDAAEAWAQTVESDGEYATEDADKLHDAVEQYRLMDLALEAAHAEQPEVSR